MRILVIIILLLIFSITAFSQKRKLGWKFTNNQSIKYAITFQNSNSGKEKTQTGLLDSLLKALPDSLRRDTTIQKSFAGFKAFFGVVRERVTNHEFEGQLIGGNNGPVEVELYPKNSVTEDADLDDIVNYFRDRYNGRSLKGVITSKGRVHGLNSKNDKANLIALLFQLPSKPVRPGGSWPLDIEFLGLNHDFGKGKTTKINQVLFEELRAIDGEDIAFLKYNIRETFKSGSLNTQLKEVEVSFQGSSSFSLRDGKWKRFEGVFSFKLSGDHVVDRRYNVSLTHLK
jgi:hypothetical protein